MSAIESKSPLLSVVEKSPAAVAVHDKKAWLSIFASFHVVEDPVGSSPHWGGLYDANSGQRGNAALDRFYETFIAPNDIVFDVQKDTVCGNHVVRDLNVNIKMAPQVNITVPMHLLYELTLEQGDWKIMHLAAHWELLPMVKQLIFQGAASFPVLWALTVRMFKLQGITGMLGFSKAVFGIGSYGKYRAQDFVRAFNTRDSKRMQDLLDSEAVLMMPVSRNKMTVEQLMHTNAKQCVLKKVMAAGDIVSASLSFKEDGKEKEGVIFFEFNKKSRKMTSVRCYF